MYIFVTFVMLFTKTTKNVSIIRLTQFKQKITSTKSLMLQCILFFRTQMQQYNSMRRASLNLRHLSHNRDTPLLSACADREARTASLNLENDPRYRRGGRGTASAPGTLNR